MRRPLTPPPDRPNPTDPGDAADLSIPQGYQQDRSVPSRERRLACPDPKCVVPFAREANRTGTEINVKPVYKVTGFAVSVKRYG